MISSLSVMSRWCFLASFLVWYDLRVHWRRIWKTLRKSTCYQQTFSCGAPKTSQQGCDLWMGELERMWSCLVGTSHQIWRWDNTSGSREMPLTLKWTKVLIWFGEWKFAQILELKEISHRLIFRAFIPDYKFGVCQFPGCLTQGTKKTTRGALGSLFTWCSGTFHTKIQSSLYLQPWNFWKSPPLRHLDVLGKFGVPGSCWASALLGAQKETGSFLVGDETHVRLCFENEKLRGWHVLQTLCGEMHEKEIVGDVRGPSLVILSWPFFSLYQRF